MFSDLRGVIRDQGKGGGESKVGYLRGNFEGSPRASRELLFLPFWDRQAAAASSAWYAKTLSGVA